MSPPSHIKTDRQTDIWRTPWGPVATCLTTRDASHHRLTVRNYVTWRPGWLLQILSTLPPANATTSDTNHQRTSPPLCDVADKHANYFPPRQSCITNARLSGNQISRRLCSFVENVASCNKTSEEILGGYILGSMRKEIHRCCMLHRLKI